MALGGAAQALLKPCSTLKSLRMAEISIFGLSAMIQSMAGRFARPAVNRHIKGNLSFADLLGPLGAQTGCLYQRCRVMTEGCRCHSASELIRRPGKPIGWSEIELEGD